MTDTTAAEGIPDYPDNDATDAAHPAWWRGHEHTAAVLCQKVNDILDGRDDGRGVSNEPWETARRRLLALAAQPSAGAQREAADMAFGFGRFVVDTGCYQEKPAVFICPVEQPGEIGASARHLGHDRHTLLPGERVLTFPTVDQAQAVADALVNATPAQPDTGDVAALRDWPEREKDIAWIERQRPVGHCGERTSEAINRGRIEDRIDRILAALSKPNAQGRVG